MKEHIESYFNDIIKVTTEINRYDILDTIDMLELLTGKLFVLGVGGSAANASHAINDFRKICNIEAYCPTDNAAELTARINDNGWNTSLVDWLKCSNLNSNDIMLVLSVGGGDYEKYVSVNLIKAMQYANEKDCLVIGIVGANGGETQKLANICITIPHHNTFYVESIQSLILHMIVSHPKLKKNLTKWESIIDDSSDIFRS